MGTKFLPFLNINTPYRIYANDAIFIFLETGIYSSQFPKTVSKNVLSLSMSAGEGRNCVKYIL